MSSVNVKLTMRHMIGAAIAAAALLTLVLPGQASAGYGLQPNGQTFQVTVDSAGYIDEPKSIPIVVYLDSLDSDAVVYISTSPSWNSYGSATGSLDGICLSSELRPFGEPNKYVCDLTTILLKPGVTYYWWMKFRRHDDASYLGSFNVSGPFQFTLAAAAPQAPPASDPTTDVPDDTEAAPSYATKEDASLLPSSLRWDGSQSIKDTKITQVVYKTMKLLTKRPRTLAFACWTDDDFDSVVADGSIPDDEPNYVTGVWFPTEPRWLHLRGTTCTWLQRLIDTKAATAKGAFGLANALHETMHAYGIKNEAQANCYAVQLVPYAAYYLGLPWKRADYLRKLGLNFVRRGAPANYWNYGRCRDGGRWDLLPGRDNLR